MNRTIVGGIAVFFAVLAIAVMGSQNDANAGWGCNGGCGGLFSHHRCHGGLFKGCHGGLFKRCHGASHADCGGSDCGGSDCGGCHSRCHGGLFARLRARRCHGCHSAPSCCGVPAPSCEPCAPACDACGGCDTGCEACGCEVAEPTCGVVEYMEEAPAEAPVEVAPEAPAAE